MVRTAALLLAVPALLGCTSVPVGDEWKFHDPNEGPVLRNTWIGGGGSGFLLTSGTKGISALRNKGVFGTVVLSSSGNARNATWEYVDTFTDIRRGPRDAYYVRVCGKDWNDVHYEGVVLYGGGRLTVYREGEFEVFLTDRTDPED